MLHAPWLHFWSPAVWLLHSIPCCYPRSIVKVIVVFLSKTFWSILNGARQTPYGLCGRQAVGEGYEEGDRQTGKTAKRTMLTV